MATEYYTSMRLLGQFTDIVFLVKISSNTCVIMSDNLLINRCIVICLSSIGLNFS